jgi:hypothetical protein
LRFYLEFIAWVWTEANNTRNGFHSWVEKITEKCKKILPT